MKREKPWLRGNFTKALYKPNGKWTPSDIAPHSAIHAFSGRIREELWHADSSSRGSNHQSSN